MNKVFRARANHNSKLNLSCMVWKAQRKLRQLEHQINVRLIGGHCSGIYTVEKQLDSEGIVEVYVL